MKLIFTSYKGIYTINTEDKCINTIHKGSGMYYGITWDKNEIFVAARNSISDYKLGNEKILVFDKDLKYKRDLKYSFENHGLHEILFDRNNKLWVTATLKNKIILIDENINYLYPDKDQKDKDFNHFNSLFLNNNIMYITAHNNGRKNSEIYEYSLTESKITKIYEMFGSTHSHNCFLLDNKLYTCASEESNIKDKDGNLLFDKVFNGYTRGVVITDNNIVVGVSSRAERENRIKADGSIFIFDKNSKEIKEKINLPEIGQVAEIRSLTDIDYRHWPDPILVP